MNRFAIRRAANSAETAVFAVEFRITDYIGINKTRRSETVQSTKESETTFPFSQPASSVGVYQMDRHTGRMFFMAALMAGSCLLGCEQAKMAPPTTIPEVAIVAIQPQQVELSSELPGRTAAYRVAEIRPQVNGLIQTRLFTEGSQVEAGEVLYEVDPAPYKAAYDSAAANLASAQQSAKRAQATLDASIATLERHEAVLSLAKTNRARYEKMLAKKAVSTMDHDQAVVDVNVANAALRSAVAQVESDRQSVGVAKAAIQQAEAALETAKINLDYTKIKSSISGRIGRSNVTDGAIATAYQTVPLATVQQLDPIYVDVPQSTVELSRLKRSFANGNLKTTGTDKVKIVLEDGTVYPLEGSLKFHDVTVDQTTGSVILRVVVPNPDGTLLPGMYVRAVIEEGVREKAILVPQQAVSRDPKGNPLTLIVDDKDQVQQRELATDRSMGDKWLVSSGLAQGDRVIVEGMQKVRPGMTVKAIRLNAGGSVAANPKDMQTITN
jgi:membrane fusion protein (multidrug efflux system)